MSFMSLIEKVKSYLKERSDEAVKVDNSTSTKQFILARLEMEFKLCLRSLKTFSVMSIPKDLASDYNDFESVAEELGFIVTFDNVYSEYILVINHQTNSLTIAQLQFTHFTSNLEKACEIRKKEVLRMCENIQSTLETGKFHCNHTWKSFFTISVYLKSIDIDYEFLYPFDHEIIFNYFKERELMFIGVNTEDQCHFLLSDYPPPK